MPNLYAIKLLFLACAVSAQAFTISPLPGPIHSICPNAQELGSSTIVVDANEVVHRTFSCPDGDFNAEPISSAVPSNHTSQLSSIQARSQAECTTPASECQCGVAVDCECAIDGITPSTSDCQTLVGSTGVIASLQGPTFLVQPKTFHVISLNTCSLGFLNLANTVGEFCWDDLGNQGNSLIASRCIDASIDFTSGICLSANQRFLTRLGHSS